MEAPHARLLRQSFLGTLFQPGRTAGRARKRGVNGRSIRRVQGVASPTRVQDPEMRRSYRTRSNTLIRRSASSTRRKASSGSPVPAPIHSPSTRVLSDKRSNILCEKGGRVFRGILSFGSCADISKHHRPSSRRRRPKCADQTLARSFIGCSGFRPVAGGARDRRVSRDAGDGDSAADHGKGQRQENRLITRSPLRPAVCAVTRTWRECDDSPQSRPRRGIDAYSRCVRGRWAANVSPSAEWCRSSRSWA